MGLVGALIVLAFAWPALSALAVVLIAAVVVGWARAIGYRGRHAWASSRK